MSEHHHNQAVPRGVLMGAAVIILLSLGLAAGARHAHLTAAVQPSPPALESRDIRFADRPDGAIAIIDSATGREISLVPPRSNGFIRGVLRGMHYQQPGPQGKLVRVTAGAVFDAVVDMRASSPSFGKWVGVDLSAANKRQLWVPAGFAHGFLVVSETAELLYKTTDFYRPEHERCIAWNDPQLNIRWPLPEGIAPIVSAKDRVGLAFADAPSYP